MCLRGVGCCFGFGGHVDEDHHGGKGSVTPYQYHHHAGGPAKAPVATTPYYTAPAERNGHQGAAYHTNGYKAPSYYDQQQQKLPVAAAAAVEEAYKAANDARRGHNYNWPAPGAVGQERAYVHSGAKGTLQTQPAMKAMVAAEGAAYPYSNYGRTVPAHRQEY